MCKFASFVLTENEVYYSRNSSSHEDIITEHKLRETTMATKSNLLRVEISPTEKWADLSSWVYKIDQDYFPSWHDPIKSEARVRTALAKMLHGEMWPKKLEDLIASMKKTPWFKPDKKPLKSWKLFTGKTIAAARAAAGDAAWDAARAAAGDAAWAAAVTIFDLKIDPKHVKHLCDRWRVWQKGYCLLCDVNGELYVYTKG